MDQSCSPSIFLILKTPGVLFWSRLTRIMITNAHKIQLNRTFSSCPLHPPVDRGRPFVFATVRHPFSRLVSAYNYMIQTFSCQKRLSAKKAKLSSLGENDTWWERCLVNEMSYNKEKLIIMVSFFLAWIPPLVRPSGSSTLIWPLTTEMAWSYSGLLANSAASAPHVLMPSWR